jgi:predicted PurR-regulated permease PerM
MIEYANFYLLIAITVTLISAVVISSLVMLRIFKVLARIAQELRTINNTLSNLSHSSATTTDTIERCQQELRRLFDAGDALKAEVMTHGNNTQQSVGELIMLILTHVVNGKDKGKK